MFLPTDTLNLIHSFCKKDNSFVSLLSTNKGYHALKCKFQYKKPFVSYKPSWTPTTISYFSCIHWIHEVHGIRELKKTPTFIKAIELFYNVSPIKPGAIPNHITAVYFNCYNKTLHAGVIPSSTTLIHFGSLFNRTISPGVIPSSVKTVYLSHAQKGFELAGEIPGTVETLVFGDNFQYIDGITLNEGIKTLHLGKVFNRPLSIRLNTGHTNYHIPRSVTKLILSRDFEYELNVGDIPRNIRHLVFGEKFNGLLHTPLKKRPILPEGLEYLELGYCYHREPEICHIPKSLKRLVVRNTYMYEYFHQYDLWFECIYKP